MKKITLGIAGSISAYKSIEILREFKKRGDDVTCVLTKEANEFVSPLTLSILSGNRVFDKFFTQETEVMHISLSRADLILIAPATFNIIGKIAAGICDDLLTSVAAATKSPCLIAPAMSESMWENPILVKNIIKLKGLGYYFIEPEEGSLACGEKGKGRLAQPKLIVNAAYRLLNRSDSLKGKRVIVTGGTTQEDIDPVRFICTKSTGRMGYCLAEAAKRRGANVTLILGPSEPLPLYQMDVTNVRSSQDMENEIMHRIENTDILIMAAAVSDYIPIYHKEKIKKRKERLNIVLQRGDDILRTIRAKSKRVFLVGFSVDTENEIENAKLKLKEKSLDLIVVNPVYTMGSEETKPTIINKNFDTEPFPRMSKFEAAEVILDRIVKNQKSVKS
jgi:phosphopantothenoylcysteine decarboxylase/phosphopantothenate--cysteine ligase